MVRIRRSLCIHLRDSQYSAGSYQYNYQGWGTRPHAGLSLLKV